MQNLNKYYLVILISLAFMTCFSGCSPTDQDVTHDKRFGDFGSSIVGKWRTRVPFYLVQGNFEGGVKLALVTEIQSDYWTKIADIPIGTEIKIDRLMLKKTISVSFLWIAGQLVEGPHVGKQIAIDPKIFPFEVMSFYEIHYDNTLKPKRPSWIFVPELIGK